MTDENVYAQTDAAIKSLDAIPKLARDLKATGMNGRAIVLTLRKASGAVSRGLGK